MPTLRAISTSDFMPNSLLITTGCRLHFGLLSLNPSWGRKFGGAGVMIDEPGFQVAFEKSEEDQVVGETFARQRAEEFLRRYRKNCPEEKQPPPCRLEIRRSIPPHVGLGSGTQLGLAVAEGLALTAGEGQVDCVTLAERVGRGRRSALGVHGFARGGFLVEAGKQENQPVGTLISRAEVPEDWRFLLVTADDPAGLSGQSEVEAFSQLPAMPEGTTAELCRQLVMEMIPSVKEEDFETFAEAVFQYGRRVGEYFSPVQQGVYASGRMQELSESLRERGVAGVVQTSWGPTVFVVCRDAETAEGLQAELRADERWKGCATRIAAGMNTGAVVEWE